MQKSKIAEGIFRYAFDPLPGKHFGNSVVAIKDGVRTLLIDTAYEHQAAKILEDLEEEGANLSGIIISHFHDDHMEGMKELPKVETYGSRQYQTTLDLWTDREEHHHYIPTSLIHVPSIFFFGKHRIEIIPSPGHSLCTVLTRIDHNYLHIADELMFSEDGRPILPSADENHLQRHVESLVRLRSMDSCIMIPAHGTKLDGKEKINREISSRISYLNAILNSSRELTYEEAAAECCCEFLHSEWHSFVYE